MLYSNIPVVVGSGESIVRDLRKGLCEAVVVGVATTPTPGVSTGTGCGEVEWEDSEMPSGDTMLVTLQKAGIASSPLEWLGREVGLDPLSLCNMPCMCPSLRDLRMTNTFGSGTSKDRLGVWSSVATPPSSVGWGTVTLEELTSADPERV